MHMRLRTVSHLLGICSLLVRGEQAILLLEGRAPQGCLSGAPHGPGMWRSGPRMQHLAQGRPVSHLAVSQNKLIPPSRGCMTGSHTLLQFWAIPRIYRGIFTFRCL